MRNSNNYGAPYWRTRATKATFSAIATLSIVFTVGDLFASAVT
jgi:hypothetical protein